MPVFAPVTRATRVTCPLYRSGGGLTGLARGAPTRDDGYFGFEASGRQPDRRGCPRFWRGRRHARPGNPERTAAVDDRRLRRLGQRQDEPHADGARAPREGGRRTREDGLVQRLAL